MFFLKNTVNTMLKNKRAFSNLNNGCNLDNDTKQKIRSMYVMTQSVYVFTFSTWAVTIIPMLIN
jgi:hypothetical protein